MYIQLSNLSNLDPVDTTNPIADLNEFVNRRNVMEYEVVEQKGLLHKPIFKMSVEVDGRLFFGLGNSKKAAKCAAARECLKYFRHVTKNVITSKVTQTEECSLSLYEEGNVKEFQILDINIMKILHSSHDINLVFFQRNNTNNYKVRVCSTKPATYKVVSKFQLKFILKFLKSLYKYYLNITVIVKEI